PLYVCLPPTSLIYYFKSSLLTLPSNPANILYFKIEVFEDYVSLVLADRLNMIPIVPDRYVYPLLTSIPILPIA
ncbi:MAG: hypothetical protein RQ885_15875, partial [Desulfurococcales archaeon]|nr:hypothetical protein [Desulfurococcales archaeon]